MKKSIAVILLWIFAASPCFGAKWMFSAIGDNRSEFASYRNVLEEIKAQKTVSGEDLPPTDLILAVGDIGPVAENFKIYQEVFKDRMPAYAPVRGNHESRADVSFVLGSILPPFGKKISLQSTTSMNYYLDWKNVRFIVLDQYSDFGTTFDKSAALKWIEGAIQSAEHADHIFLAFHEPYLPEEPESNAFWTLLLKHGDKVRAVFAGHLHFYDRKWFPAQNGGIYYINVGNSGQSSHSDNRQTITDVIVDGREISFRVIQARNGTADFKVRRQWKAGRSEASDGNRSGGSPEYKIAPLN